MVRSDCKGGSLEEKLITLEAVPYMKKLAAGPRVPATRCQPLVLRQSSRPCGCTEKPKVLRKCLQGNSLNVIETNYHFNETLQACHSEVVRHTYLTSKLKLPFT